MLVPAVHLGSKRGVVGREGVMGHLWTDGFLRSSVGLIFLKLSRCATSVGG